MKLRTTRFGTLHVDEESVIEMPAGMPGFDEHRKFVILPHNDKSPFFWYQSAEDPGLAFVITNPYLFLPDYHVNVDGAFAEMPWDPDLDRHQLVLYVVVNIPEGAPEKITANLIAPLLVNHRMRQAVQMIVPDSSYSHQHSLVRSQ